MNDKIKVILNSPRFWMVSAAALFQVLKALVPGKNEVWDILSIWLGAVVTIGSLDSAAGRIGGSVNIDKATVENVNVAEEPKGGEYSMVDPKPKP